jgi:hypothetical protein
LYVRVPPTALERFWEKVDRRGPDDCWPWTGAVLRNGYGYFGEHHGRVVLAHRWIYKQMVGPIPKGLDLDHGCHNRDPSCPGGWSCLHRRCVNYVRHLVPATPADNRRRGRTGGSRPKTHCKRGHEFTPENTYVRPNGTKACRICTRKQDRERKRRYRAMLT